MKSRSSTEEQRVEDFAPASTGIAGLDDVLAGGLDADRMYLVEGESGSGKTTLRTTVETPMKGYNDLDILRELPVELYLVTSGFRRLQESKIKALNFEHLFTETHVDAIDEVERKGKQGIFESILDAKQLRPEEVIVVGDNPRGRLKRLLYLNFVVGSAGNAFPA